jgi:hypothetical protein
MIRVRSAILVTLALTVVSCKLVRTYETRAKPTGTIQTIANPPQGGTVAGGGTYAMNSAITLQANPNANWSFTQWQDGLTASSRTVVVKRGTMTFTASFVTNPPPVYGTINLVAEPLNGGSVAGAGTYPAGNTVNISASPAPNWSFQRWQDGDASNPRIVTVPRNATVLYTATFVTNPPAYGNVSVGASPAQGGTVTGGGSYVVGTVVTVSAVANANWRFINWSDGVGAATRSVTVPNGTINMVANFQNFGTITLTVEPPNAGTVAGGGTYPVGQVVTIAANPTSTNWMFQQWQDGVTNSQRQLTVISGTVQMTATFATNKVSGVHGAKIYWNPAGGSATGTYIVYWGTAPGNYGTNLLVTTTNATIGPLNDALTYYASVRSIDINGLQSVPSCELSWKYPGSNSCQ